MADVNYISFTGDKDGSVFMNGVMIFDSSTDGIREYVINSDVVPPEGISDSLKFSGVKRLHVIVNGIVYGGKEDCVDVNNKCEDISVTAVIGFVPNGNFVSTIKGASKRIKITGKVLGHGKEVDFDLGNYSDQSDNETQGVFLDVWADFEITWRQLNASDITLRDGTRFNSELRIRGGFWRNLFAKVYAILKKIGIA